MSFDLMTSIVSEANNKSTHNFRIDDGISTKKFALQQSAWPFLWISYVANKKQLK